MSLQPTDPPPPSPPAPGAAPPLPPPTAPPAQRKGWSKGKRLLVALPLAIVIAVGGTLLLKAVIPNPTEDARNAMRDARAQVTRSFPLGQDASRHTVAVLRAESFARNRRTAIADLDRVIRLRRRAIGELAGVPSKADVSYRGASNSWEKLLRRSIGDARSLRAALAGLRAGDLSNGVVAVQRATGFHITRKTALMPLKLTAFIGSDLTLRRFDRVLRAGNSWIR